MNDVTAKLARPPLPGEPNEAEQIARMIRVDHAGEYGAVRIYEGQLAALRDAPARKIIETMLAQERPHLEEFTRLMAERRVRPTALMPVWHVGGFLLGAVTAAMGTKAAMACTAAVESVIDEHYAAQKDALGLGEKELAATIEQFRQDELHHHDTAIEEGAEQAPLYELLHGGIRGVTKLAIWLSTRI